MSVVHILKNVTKKWLNVILKSDPNLDNLKIVMENVNKSKYI